MLGPSSRKQAYRQNIKWPTRMFSSLLRPLRNIEMMKLSTKSGGSQMIKSLRFLNSLKKRSWLAVWRKSKFPEPANTGRETLRDIFELLEVLKIFSTLPVTSCGSREKLFHSETTENFLRSTMGEERLNSLAVINIHREICNIVMENDIKSLWISSVRARGGTCISSERINKVYYHS